MAKTWFERIKEAEKRGTFTFQDIDAAGDWVTCACGEQDSGISRHPITNWPMDAELYSLGKEFSNAVTAHNTQNAGTILAEIQKRSAEILARKITD